MNRRELILGAGALSACGPVSGAPLPAFPMQRGVNLGNALEAPNEGEWGYRIERAHLAAIAAAGFDGVRLPVRWDAHTEQRPPYVIAPAFLDRVDAIVADALALGLKVQLDCHHYDALITAPDSERARFAAIWRQIADYFSATSDALIFEPLNEPNGERWSGALLTTVQAEAVAAIRETNPTRLIVLGPGQWQAIDALGPWRPPEDANLAMSIHYYEPHEFTHENASWLGADAPVYGREWGGPRDLGLVTRHADIASDWAVSHGMAWQLGEFGVNGAVPIEQRALWTRAVRQAFERDGAGWCVWDFAGAFPIWDTANESFIPEMLEALFD
ncbi:MAG: glycoside hydrolase family 5 protein [Hyphomonadaceae bacterium]|nr:glycoside hydrolase family 5 protein [Hyphomonadaceae bacterium]